MHIKFVVYGHPPRKGSQITSWQIDKNRKTPTYDNDEAEVFLGARLLHSLQLEGVELFGTRVVHAIPEGAALSHEPLDGDPPRALAEPHSAVVSRR